MRGLSDEDVEEIYDAFKEYAERSLRDDDNPNLSPCAFNEIPPPTLTHILIKLTGVNRVDYRYMDELLLDFPKGGAELYQEETPEGKPEYWVKIPLPKRRKKRNTNSPRSLNRHSASVVDTKPSCTMMLLYVIGLLSLGIIATLFTTKQDWAL